MLTRREEFAKAAMQGLMTHFGAINHIMEHPNNQDKIAKMALDAADALERQFGPVEYGPDGARLMNPWEFAAQVEKQK